MMRSLAVIILTASTYLHPFAAAAADGALVKLSSEVLREVVVVDESGTTVTQRVPVSSAAPGETLTFVISYVNEGDQEAGDIVLTNPVPQHMVYVGGGPESGGAVMSYSVDGGNSFARAGSLKVFGDDGEERPAGPADYTHIRWTFTEPIPPGARGTVTFRARVR